MEDNGPTAAVLVILCLSIQALSTFVSSNLYLGGCPQWMSSLGLSWPPGFGLGADMEGEEEGDGKGFCPSCFLFSSVVLAVL